MFPLNGGVRSLFWFCAFGGAAMALMSASSHDWLWAAIGAMSSAFIVLLLRALPRELAIDDDEIHDRMRKGLSMTAGRDLLLLCAWAYASRGEHDDARFAWRQARDREGSQRLDIAMPALAAWMTSYLAAHPDLDDPDPDDET